MNFVSYPQLSRDVRDWAMALPRPGVVVGVERSGMLPATMLAKQWNVPALTVWEAKQAPDPAGGFLIVDDSYNFGQAMTKAKHALRDRKHRTGAVYVADDKAKVDHYFRVLPQPRIFEWNVFHHDIIEDACLDLDGVICEDVPAGCNDDGPRYAEFLKSARPWHIPSKKVGAIVTGRLDKYRPQTEAWLSRHHVKYDRLVMMPFRRPEERRAYGIEKFKSEIYSGNGSRLFIENEYKQSLLIAVATKKPVLHADNDGEWRLM